MANTLSHTRHARLPGWGVKSQGGAGSRAWWWRPRQEKKKKHHHHPCPHHSLTSSLSTPIARLDPDRGHAPAQHVRLGLQHGPEGGPVGRGRGRHHPLADVLCRGRPLGRGRGGRRHPRRLPGQRHLRRLHAARHRPERRPLRAVPGPRPRRPRPAPCARPCPSRPGPGPVVGGGAAGLHARAPVHRRGRRAVHDGGCQLVWL